MSNYDIIKQAIENRQSITCEYNGYLRKMTPHVLGTKSGMKHVLCYQYGGASKSGLSINRVENWRCIEVDYMINLKINSYPFETADNHGRKQSCVDYIDAEIDY